MKLATSTGDFSFYVETVTRPLSPSADLKKKAISLLYETGKYILESYDCFEE